MLHGMTTAATTSPLRAFLVACCGIALFSLMDALMKGLALSLGAYNALLWRSLAGSAIGGTLYLLARTPLPTRAAMRLHLWRGFVVAFMALLFFWAVTRLPLAEAIALSFIAPLIALYLAAVLLGEKVGRRAVFASLLGLAGVGIIMAGRLSNAQHVPGALMGVLAVLASATLYAYSLILGRQQAQIAQPAEIAFFQSAMVFITLLLVMPPLLMGWNFVQGTPPAPLLALIHLPPPGEWMAIAGAATLAVVSLILLSWAYARAEAQVLIPVEYTAFIWAAICGWIFFHEPVTLPTLGGTVLIVCGCLIAARTQKNPPHVEEVYA